MPSNQTDLKSSGRVSARLLLSVHMDAARHAPRAYLAALWWRLRGKQVRARGRFAPLLGVSPKAYQLWMLQQEIGKGEPPAASSPELSKPLIVALVEAGGDRKALDESLRSLEAEGVPALVVGTEEEIAAPADVIRHIDWSGEPWLMPIRAGDLLAQGAIDAYRAVIARTVSHIAYSDDDLLDSAGHRIAPHFKPEWNSELFRHFDYLTGACIVRASREGLASLSGADWASRIVTLAAGQGDNPCHVPRILHHRRLRPQPRALAAPVMGARQALPPVSVIVPTRNRVDLLRTCLEGVARTDYADLEVIIVDNGSDDPATLAYLASLDPARHRVLRHPGPFNFSTMNNRAAAEAGGSLLCLLNNDIEVLAPDWLAVMATQALRPEVGAVGAQLLYPDRRIQHAGVVIGVGGAAAHAHRLLRPQDEGYFRRHALPQFVSAVTAACLVVQRDRFMAVDGLDEENFAVAFNDVDLCLRLNRRGWQSLYEPRATLIHHESVSRGFDHDPAGAARFAGELAALKRLWGTEKEVDPFHHPELSRASERFVLRL